MFLLTHLKVQLQDQKQQLSLYTNAQALDIRHKIVQNIKIASQECGCASKLIENKE
jgi:hypothetical protein